MTKIELLPKWYAKEERKDRTEKMKKAVKDLLNSNLLPDMAIEELKRVTCNMDLFVDTYSRNYEIKIVNKWIDFYNSLKK